MFAKDAHHSSRGMRASDGGPTIDMT